MGMAGQIYLVGAVVLGFALLYFGIRLAFFNLPLVSAQSKFARGTSSSYGDLSSPALCLDDG